MKAKTYFVRNDPVANVFLIDCFLVHYRQVVGNRLFTGSHDATLRVWDITGIKDDGRDDKDKLTTIERMNGDTHPDGKQNGVDNGQTRIMIGDDEPANGHAQPNGSAQLGVHLDEKRDSRDDQMMMA